MNATLRKSLAEQKRQERKLFRELKDAFAIIERSLVEQAERIFVEMATNPNKLYEMQRLNALLAQVRTELQRYADNVVVPTVADGMVQSSFLGSEQARQVLREIYGDVVSIQTLPRQAITEFTRHLTTGPLGDLFASFGQVAAAKARRDLLAGIALGQNPKKLARTLQQSLGVSRSRALLIARTETMRAHREGNRQSYRRNRGLVTGWIWHAATGPRTCAACWAMHGTEHDLDEPMAAHPACRCTMVPRTRTWKQLGYNIDETSRPIPKGNELFAQQDEATQRAVLGNTQYQRYKAGEVELDDFVAIRRTRYGNTILKRVPT